jgi:phosphatidylglycerophosphate synthase
MLRRVPWILIIVRLLMAPVVLWNCFTIRSGPLFVIALSVAFVTDIYDGIIARRLGVATLALRRYNSIVDLLFYVAVLYCAWHLYPGVIQYFAIPILALLILEGTCQAISFVRFHVPAATHTYSAKTWGILLFVSLGTLLGAGRPEPMLFITISFGFLVEIEVLTILLIIPRSSGDVHTLFHAFRLCGEERDRLSLLAR